MNTFTFPQRLLEFFGYSSDLRIWFASNQLNWRKDIATRNFHQVRSDVDHYQCAIFNKNESSPDNFDEMQAELNKASTTDVMALMIAAGLKLKASDIHVEAEEKAIAVRLRIDGVLQDAAEIEQRRWKQIISRIKWSAFPGFAIQF